MQTTLKMDGDPTLTLPTSQSVTSSVIDATESFRKIVQDMLITDNRFTGMSRYVLRIEFFWSSAISTACAGHGFIFFNPEFWKRLDPEQQKTIVAHEIYHLILDHLNRMEGYDPDTHNQASDHVINLTLMHDGFKMAPGMDFGGITPCCDPRFTGMSTEEIYDIILKERKAGSGSHSSPAGTPSKSQIEDLVEEVLKGTGTDLEEQKDQNAAILQEVTQKAISDGTPTGGTARLLDTEGKKVEVKTASYEEIFEKYLTEPLSGGKRTFLRPSRRQGSGQLRTKGRFPKQLRGNKLKHLVYALDVSGSITHKQANQFLRSASTLKQKLNPVLMTVMFWDHAIQFEKTFREDEKLDKLQVFAGGSTNLNPVYKRVSQLQPEALVIFTDLAVNIPPEPEWDTIWFVPHEDVYQGYLQAVTYGDVYVVPEEQ